MAHRSALRLLAPTSLGLLLVGGCVFGGSDAALVSAGPVCSVLDFDTDADGNPIEKGQIVEEAYESRGIEISTWSGRNLTVRGLAVAFDSEHPTGGDNDLGFDGLGNVLINQDDFDYGDFAEGGVDVPDDEECGNLFEVRFTTPVCVNGLTLLDIDRDEGKAKIELFNAADTRTLVKYIAPGGDHERVDVELPDQARCDTVRMTVRLRGSGAVDNISYCEAPEVDPVRWTQTLDLGAGEAGNAVDVDGSGRVVLGGHSNRGIEVDGVVAVYDPAGTLVWQQLVDGGDADSVEGVAADAEGNVVAVGAIGDGGLEDLFVRKYDRDGNLIWTDTFDGGGVDSALDADIGADGSIAVIGVTAGADGNDIFVRLYDADGNPLWTDLVDEGNADIGHGIAIDDDGNVIAGGQIGGDENVNAWVRKYDAAGAEIWTRTIETINDEIINGVAVDHAGNVAVAGALENTTGDAFVRSYDADGNERWTQQFDGGGDDFARGVATDSAGNVIAHGVTSNGLTDAWTRKYTSDGGEVFTRIFDTGSAEIGTGVATGPGDEIAVTGLLLGAGGTDAFVRVYEP